jgi:sortase (surface protein transpeptidase)
VPVQCQLCPEWLLEVPALGLRSRVLGGDANRITNAGHSWHWTGTGFLGQDAHVAAFAHRTSAGGPYRNTHFLSAGDQIILTAADSRQYTYEVVRRDLTNSRVDNILAATRFHPGTTFSLIACTRPDFTPTSTAWRILVTAQLIGWRELA